MQYLFLCSLDKVNGDLGVLSQGDNVPFKLLYFDLKLSMFQYQPPKTQRNLSLYGEHYVQLQCHNYIDNYSVIS